MTRQPSGRLRSGAGPSGSSRLRSPDTISFGRPVEPPDVGAFQAGDTASGSGLVSVPAGGRCPSGSQVRPPTTSAAPPMTTAGSASSTMASISRGGSLALTGWGTAPSFQAAAMATYQSVEFGSAMVTMSPSPTPRPARSRASALAASSSWRRVSRLSPHDTAGRSGAASARAVRRRANETRVTAPLCHVYDALAPYFDAVASTSARVDDSKGHTHGVGLFHRPGVSGAARLGRAVLSRGDRAVQHRVPGGRALEASEDAADGRRPPAADQGPRALGALPRPRARWPRLRPAQAGAHQRDPGPLPRGAGVLRHRRARHRQHGDARRLRHRRAEGALALPAHAAGDLVGVLDDRAPGRVRPEPVQDD